MSRDRATLEENKLDPNAPTQLVSHQVGREDDGRDFTHVHKRFLPTITRATMRLLVFSGRVFVLQADNTRRKVHHPSDKLRKGEVVQVFMTRRETGQGTVRGRVAELVDFEEWKKRYVPDLAAQEAAAGVGGKGPQSKAVGKGKKEESAVDAMEGAAEQGSAGPSGPAAPPKSRAERKMERKEARKAARAAAKREALLYELADDLRGRELHSTEELLFLDKPGRCPMHPGYGNPERVLPLTERLALAFPGEQLRTVNRLDKDTTGVVVLARSEEAARRLGDAFAKNTSDAIEQARKEAVEEVVDEASTEAVDEAGQAADAASAEGEEAAAREVDEDGEDWDGVPEGLTKEYLAFLNGPLDADIPDSDTVRNYIGLVGAPGHEVMRMREDPAPGTREAVTSYRVLARFPLGSVVLFVPETGRKHQVRAFAANVLRTPVMGDRKFNRESRAKRFGLCLHCSRLTVEGTTVVAALPKDWVPWGEERGISAAQLQKAVAGYYEGLIAEGAVGYFENFVVNAKGVAVTPKPFAFTVTQRAAQDSAAKWQPSASESETVEAEAAEGEAETVAADAAEAEESHSETAEVVDASAEAADAALKQKGRGRKRRLFSK